MQVNNSVTEIDHNFLWGIFSVSLSIILFLLGHHLGKKRKKELLEQDVKSRNIQMVVNGTGKIGNWILDGEEIRFVKSEPSTILFTGEVRRKTPI